MELIEVFTSATISTFLRETFKSMITLNDESVFHCEIIAISSIGILSLSLTVNSKLEISLASNS